MAKKSQTTEEKMLAGLKKGFKGASIRTMAEAAEQARHEVIPTGIDVLDKYVMGCGGLLAGRCTEIFGDPDAGKTSMLQRCLASAQERGGVAVLVESENTLVHERGQTYGLDPERVILTEPPSIDDVLAQIQEVINLIPKDVGPNLVGWDSLAGSPAASVFKGKNPAGAKARQMSDLLPAITKLLLPKRAHLFIINQLRHQIGVFGDPSTSPGGNTLKFMASHRLQMWRGKGIERGYGHIGHYVTVKAVKNKTHSPWRKVKLRLDYGTGWNNEWSVFNLAKDLGLIKEDSKFSAKNYELALEALEKEDCWDKGAA